MGAEELSMEEQRAEPLGEVGGAGSWLTDRKGPIAPGES